MDKSFCTTAPRDEGARVRVIQTGRVVTLPDWQAKRMVDDGRAEWVDAPVREAVLPESERR